VRVPNPALRWTGGADQVDLVAGCAQTLFQPLHGEGDAVHFRWIGLGDDGIAHGGPPVSGMLGPGDVADMTALRPSDDGGAGQRLGAAANKPRPRRAVVVGFT
jgi:hypothetical protein